MSKKPNDVHSCVTCEGDAMLEVRRHASELFAVMNLLSNEYGHSHGIDVPQWVAALIEAEKDQRRLVASLRAGAERRSQEIDSLITSLRFISDCTKETYNSGVNLSGKAMAIQLTEVFRVAIHRLQSISTGDKGLLEGRQPQNERNFTAELIAAKGKALPSNSEPAW